jgi:hypothetical protein
MDDRRVCGCSRETIDESAVRDISACRGSIFLILFPLDKLLLRGGPRHQRRPYEVPLYRCQKSHGGGGSSRIAPKGTVGISPT